MYELQGENAGAPLEELEEESEPSTRRNPPECAMRAASSKRRAGVIGPTCIGVLLLKNAPVGDGPGPPHELDVLPLLLVPSPGTGEKIDKSKC